MSDRVEHTGPQRIRALITGAGSGVGEATARLFAGREATVALLGRRVGELARVAADIGVGAYVFPADVRDEASVEAAVAEAVQTMGGIDVVVNAAGVASTSPLEDMSERVWSEVVETNLTGTFHVCRAALPHLREGGGGAIVNVASDLATMGAAGLTHYSAAKAGVVGFTQGLAVELAPSIRVNVVCPGPVDTPMLRGGLDPHDLDASLRAKRATVPLARLAEPIEIARAIWSLGVEGTFTTGMSMAVDGGTTAA